MDEGLPQNSITCIAQTADGYLWLGTEAGLTRFDGMRFEIFNHDNIPAFTTNYIASLLADSRGALWIGTRGSGLIRQSNRFFQAFKQKDGLLDDNCHGIIESRDSTIWIGNNTGLTHLFDGKFETIPIPVSPSLGNFRALLEDRNGWIWAGAVNGGGLFVIKKKGQTYDIEFKGIRGSRIFNIIQDRKGTIWLATMTGLIALDNNHEKIYTVKYGLSTNCILSLFEDRAGNIWIGTYGGGICILNPITEKITIHDDPDIINGSVIYSFLEDQEGSLWIGTDGGGLNRLRDTKVMVYSKKSGLSSDIVNAVFEDSRGNIWVGTKGQGVNCIDPKTKKIQTYSTRNGLNSDLIVSIAESPKGVLWFGTLGSGVDRLDLRNNRIDHFPLYTDIGDISVGTIYADPEGNIWVGTYNGSVYRFESNRFSLYYNLKARINSLFKDSLGRFWACTIGIGLCRMKQGKIECMGEGFLAGEPNIMSIFEDKDHILWLGLNSDGLNCYYNGKCYGIGKKDGLPDNLIYSILADKKDNLWMSSNNGIFWANRQEILQYITGKTKRIQFMRIGKEDGLLSDECNGGHQPSSYLASDGKIYIPTTRGLVMVDPENIPYNTLPPKVHIESIIIDGKCLPVQNDTIIPPGDGNLDFQFTGVSFLVPRKIAFKYKLEGFDKTWIYAGTRRSVSYKGIPPGRYTFNVIARNSDGIWGTKGAAFTFTLTPRFYQTLTFKIVFPLALITISILIYFIFNRIMNNRKLARKFKQTSITPEESSGILKKIVYTIEVEKGYCDPDITLKSFSTKTKIPQRVISIVINEHLKKNFFEFINSYRVKEAMEILQDPKKNNISILDVGYEVGFNSKSAFNRAFKQFVKITPSEFRKKKNPTPTPVNSKN